MTTLIEAMKQALEALRFGLHVGFDESSESQIKKCGKAFDQHNKAITSLRQAIEQAEKQEPVAWKNAAIRLGEELSSVGPDGYYNMTAAQWLDWAMDQQPRGKNSLNTPPAAQRKPHYDKTEMNCFVQNLYDQKMREGKRGHYETMFHVVHRAIEAAHGIQEKNHD